jgi:Centromere DNA-binding protein complex CBF3 subunit, domain 2
MSTRLITTYLSHQREANARRAREANANGTDVVFSPGRHVRDTILHSHLQTSVITMQEDSRPENTMKAMDPKTKEYFAYCELEYPNDAYKYILNFSKVYKFMYYQSFREQKQRGGKKQEKELFDLEQYRELMSCFNGYEPDSAEALEKYPKPSKPIGRATFDQYKAVFRTMYRVQKAKGVLSEHWDGIWMMSLDEMAMHVKTRAPRIKRETYQEKVDGEFAPYIIVEQYSNIEEGLWNDSNVVSRRMIATRLRHRYCCQHLTAGILRCESLHKAEWSDFLGITIPKSLTDVDDMYCMINQIPLGKTNKGRILYGRALRHKDVRLCCLGGLAFYAQYRFDCTNEFVDFTPEDWVQRNKWFDVKVLVDVQSGNYKKELSKDTYGTHIGAILARLKICCNKLCHLGRNLGARILEMLEEESEEIRRMGQWSPSVFDNSYSAKLPLGPMRKLAGFSSSSKMYYNPRTTVEPDETLLRLTPMGKWCYDALQGVLEISNDGKNQTAISTLKFFCELNKVTIQDAAAMQVLHPEREYHPFFDELNVFSSSEFKVRCSWLIVGSVSSTLSLLQMLRRIIRKKCQLFLAVQRIQQMLV